MSKVYEWQHLKIPFKEIEVATENFKTLIGQGGYGWVYKGKLLLSGKETMVAVKRLNEQFGQGLKEFLTEIQLLTGQHHPNLISLIGYCDEGKEKTIVYEYAERGSLDQYIRRSGKSTSTTLTWSQRLRICLDAARGLDHLHRHVGGHRMIIHRDIKSSNILIDKNWVGKVSDLGLSKLSVSGFGMSVIVSNGCGTQGYCEPEYYSTGIVTKKSDVFSFGIVLFEVLCGRLCLIDCDDGFSLSSISAKEYYKNNSLDKIIDHSLRGHIGSYSMTKFAAIAYRCLHDDREQRPAMDVVAKELEEALRFLIESIPSGNLPPEFDPDTCHNVYVDNVHTQVTELLLREVFASTGPVEGCKLIRKDKSSYGYIHYFDRTSAALAILSLNGRLFYGQPIKVNWALASGQREDTSGHYKIFVGNLSPDVTDAMLFVWFSAYASCSDARVLRDQKTGHSRGSGFVSFQDQQDAQSAIDSTGRWLGSTRICCNWATKGAGTSDEKQGSDSKTVVELTNGLAKSLRAMRLRITHSTS